MLFDFTLKRQRNEDDMDVDFWNVKNLKEHTESVPADTYFEISWEDHRSLIMSILRGEHHHVVNVQTAYELSTNICHSGKAKELYKRLYRELASHFTEVASLLATMATSNDDFLGYLNTMWAEKKDQIAQIGQIFCELDRGYVLRHTHYRSITNIGIHLFKTNVLEQPLIKERLLQNLLFLIRNDRKDRMVDTELMRSLIQLLQDAGMYKSEFEPRLLESMAAYYEHEAERLINKLSVADYLLYANHQIRREELQQAYLLGTTRNKLARIVSERLARSNMNTLVSKGLYTMIDTNDMNSLKILHGACRSNELSIVRQAIMSYTKERGASLFERHQNDMDGQNDTRFLKLLMKFKAKLERVVQGGLGNDATLSRAVGDALGDLFREHEQQVTQMLVRYVDNNMRQMQSEAQAKESCEKVLGMFRYLHEKDAFEVLYKLSLAKRLLLCASIIRHESIIVDGLASACGAEYVEDIQKIVSDVTESQELTDEFINAPRPRSNINLTIMTLEKTRWSSHIVKDIISIPPELTPILNSYEAFYKEKFPKRQLNWAHSLGTCTLKAYFSSGLKTLVASFTQARILLEFNDFKLSHTLIELSSKLSIGKPELEYALESLCHPNHPILVANAENSSQTKYQYNALFNNDKEFIVVNHSANQNEQQSKLATRVAKIKLNDNRKYQIEAAAVRVMKKKRRLKYADLDAELRSLLPFPIDTRELKQAIESLIQKSLMERVSRSALTYAYVQ